MITQKQITELQIIQDLENEMFEYANAVRIARLNGKSEDGINHLCDSKLSTMMQKTNEFLKPKIG